jgi:GDPmannose 4,6-dehydratase
MKRALIIGISGQDGSYLAKFLVNKGSEVVGFSRDAMVTSFSNLKNWGLNSEFKTFPWH